MVSSSRMPPPICTGTLGCAPVMARMIWALRGLPSTAPSRSTMCSRRQPASTQIDKMKPFCSGCNPTRGDLDRIVGEHGLVVHPSLAQAYAAPSLQVNRGYEQHGGRA